jgi:anthranilate phosphoribosyltransferase
MDGTMTPAQAGSFLMGLKTKGETPEELAAGVDAALRHARPAPGLSGALIDTCGTGGDASCSFNCSTAVALMLAAMGYQVVKHGNRSVSSQCGSADVLEMLGLPILVEPGDVAGEVEKNNFAFLFAPNFHPAFKHIMPVRKEIGCRTLFNMLGPLLNPARPTHQLLGVALPEYVERMARVLALTGVKSAVVVHGAGAVDELTCFGVNRVVWVRDGWTRNDTIDPEKLGFKQAKPEEVAVAGKQQALEALRAVLSGKGPRAMMDMAALNLAAAVTILEDDLDLARAADKAREAVYSGVGKRFVAGA